MARAREMLDLIDQHGTGVDLILAVDDHHGLSVFAVADGNRHQRLAQKMAVVIAVAGLPQAARLLHAIAERVHDEDRRRHHQAVLGDAEQIRPANALAAGDAIHVEQNDVDPLHPRIGVEEVLRLVEGEPRVGHVATPLAAAPKRRNSATETGFALRRPFGMPLHAQTEGRVIGPAHGLDQTVLGEGLGLQRLGEARDALPVQRIDHDLVFADPVAQFPAQPHRVDRPVALVERNIEARAMILVTVHGVNGLIQAAAKRDVQLLEAAADREERRLALDRGADQRQRQRVAQGIEPVGHERRFLAVMLGRDIRHAARKQDRVGHLEDGADIRHAGTDRHEQRLALGDLGDRRRIFASHGVKDVTFDQLGTGRNDDDRTAHAASSPATSLRVRSSARPITCSASSNCCCVQISGGAMTMVSNTARMMKPSRKK